jgi:hypothetical protein
VTDALQQHVVKLLGENSIVKRKHGHVVLFAIPRSEVFEENLASPTGFAKLDLTKIKPLAAVTGWRLSWGGYKPGSRNWTKQQKRVFQRLTSWCCEAKFRDCQLSRVDLTTARGGPARLLRRHLQELRRRVERDLGYKGVETSEGNGHLHMVWAWAGDREFIIDQRWLSEMWAAIHGTPIVFIRRMHLAKDSIRRVGRYFALQYLSDQRGALIRMSWSWKRSRFAIGKAWSLLIREFVSRTKHVGGLPDSTFPELLVAWEKLLEFGWCRFGVYTYCVVDRVVRPL